MIPKQRLNALTDGVFAVAMTLLVFDLHLPEAFQPSGNSDLIGHLLGLRHQVVLYAVSFYVLALCWIGRARSNPRDDEVGKHHVALVLAYLLLITLLPFSTSVIGQFHDLPAAICLYACNMFLIGTVSLRISLIAGMTEGAKSEAILGFAILSGSAIASIILSFVQPHWAIFAFGLNFVEAPVRLLKYAVSDNRSKAAQKGTKP